MMHSRGQTSLELLLVISFVLVLVLAIVLPYVESQNISNASIAAKISILPYIEKNGLRVKINSIAPESSGGTLTLHIVTSGSWDDAVFTELRYNPLTIGQSGCERVCAAAANLNAYSLVTLDWRHAGTPLCQSSPGVNLTC